MDVRVSLPLDNDGFLRRECPHCVRQFKWHHGPATAEAEGHSNPETYHCPFCGQPALSDAWWTQEQLTHLNDVGASVALQHMDNELRNLLRGLDSKYVKVKRTGHLDVPGQPMPLTEPDDMTIVASPCHSYEPVKVPDTDTGPFHCLVCGVEFAV